MTGSNGVGIGNVPARLLRRPASQITTGPIRARLRGRELRRLQAITAQMAGLRAEIIRIFIDAGLDPRKVYRVTPDGSVTDA